MDKEKISIGLSENDLEDLQNGLDFNWTFTGDKGNEISVHIYNESRMGSADDEIDEE